MRNLVMLLVLVVVGGIVNAQTAEQKILMTAYQQHLGSQHITKAYIAANLGIAPSVFNKQAAEGLISVSNSMEELKANCSNTKVQALLKSFETSLATHKKLLASKRPSQKDFGKILENTEAMTAVSGHIVEILKRENEVVLNVAAQEWELIYKTYDNAFWVENISTKYMASAWKLDASLSKIEISKTILKIEKMLGEMVEMTEGNEKANEGVLKLLYRWAVVEKHCTALNTDKKHKSLAVANQVLGNSELVMQETRKIVNTILNAPTAMTSDQGN